jgi:hypothetical protein
MPGNPDPAYLARDAAIRQSLANILDAHQQGATYAGRFLVAELLNRMEGK